jgi:hypothetical protein
MGLVEIFVLACESHDLRPEILFSVVVLKPGSEWVTFTDVKCRKIIIQARRACEEIDTGLVEFRPELCLCEPRPRADDTSPGPVGLVNSFYSVRSAVDLKDADRTPALFDCHV